MFKKDTVRQNDGLVLDLDGVTVFSRQHVDFSLINTQLADIGLQVEDVSALHARVEDLRSKEFFFITSAHDLWTSVVCQFISLGLIWNLFGMNCMSDVITTWSHSSDARCVWRTYLNNIENVSRTMRSDNEWDQNIMITWSCTSWHGEGWNDERCPWPWASTR